MKVKNLIVFLQTKDPELSIVFHHYSEQCMLDVDDITEEMLCKPRADGWVANARPDKELVPYLVFPGN